MARPRAIASLAEEGIDSERVVLGSLLLEPQRLQKLAIDGSHFGKRHRPIFDALLACSVDRGDFDPMSVTDLLRKRGQYTEGDAEYVSSLTSDLPRHIALDHHCAKIKTAALRRRLALLCESITSSCYDLIADPEEILTRLRDEAAAIEAPGANGAGVAAICGSEVAKIEAAEWLVEPFIPRACLSLLVGDPGDGKTWVALSLAAAITRGRNPFDGAPAPCLNVLYLSNEDSNGELMARFDRLGGDRSRIWLESPDRALNLSEASAIDAEVKKHDINFLAIDTVTSHFGAKVDFHKASEVAAMLAPISALAQRTRAGVLGNMHLSKAGNGKSLYRVQGSTAFAGAARSILAVGSDRSDPSRRILAHLKSNGSALAPSRSFTIGDNGLAWGEISDLRACDVMGPESSSEERSESSAAVEFLREALSNGSRDAAEVKSEAKAEGIAERTLARAKVVLGIKSRKKSMKEGWIWWLREECHEGGHESLPF